jgi:penicillin-binding protein 1A
MHTGHDDIPRGGAFRSRICRAGQAFRRQPRHKRLLLGTIASLLLLLVVGGSLFTAYLVAGLPDVSGLDKYNPAAGTKIYAADGTLIANLVDESRNYVKYQAIAPTMLQAIVAVEDKRFFEHGGVDLRGVGRALLGNMGAGGVEQGASTLTMQLARRLFLTNERTYSRKVREAVLAYRMDGALSKEKILELYLNEVYFGSGAYGIGAAADLYFDKKPGQLELWESALLAGLVQAPSLLSPLQDRPAALKRMNEVLEAMLEEGKISEKQMMQARNEAATYHFTDHQVRKRESLLKYPYFTHYVMDQLARQFPEKNLRRGGLQVVTSMNVAMQEEAERALGDTLHGAGAALGADTGAVVALDNDTGEVVAMVGGLGWSDQDQFNRAWQAKRQPGSAFKPFVYAAALQEGYNPEQEFADTAATFGPASNPWTPSNSDGRFMGAIPMRTGLQYSRNLVAAKVIAHVGPEKVIELAHRMGISSDLPNYASLALGAGEVTPLQMARAYSAFPCGGIIGAPRVIRKVSSADGSVLLDFTDQSHEQRVLGEEAAKVMCEMLRRVVTMGTGTAAGLPDVFVAGKTGTTDSFEDAWFVGFTPRHTLAVWMGRDDNQPMGQLYGGSYPAQVFARVARAGLSGLQDTRALPGVEFDQPTEVTLCADSGYLALPGCPRTYVDTFQAGVIPTRKCPMHRTAGDLDPRHDPEVVTPQGARIPYTEQEPGLLPVRSPGSDDLEAAPASPEPDKVKATATPAPASSKKPPLVDLPSRPEVEPSEVSAVDNTAPPPPETAPPAAAAPSRAARTPAPAATADSEPSENAPPAPAPGAASDPPAPPGASPPPASAGQQGPAPPRQPIQVEQSYPKAAPVAPVAPPPPPPPQAAPPPPAQAAPPPQAAPPAPPSGGGGGL